MKKTIYLLMFFTSCVIYGQNNFDIILKTSAEELEGTVTEISDSEISFKHKNESLLYKIPKKEIVKITFASGRIEFYNKLATEKSKLSERSNSPGNIELSSHHNKVAILPFAYIKDDRDGSQSVSNKIQNEAYSLFKSYRGQLSYQDPNATNALLIKSGVKNNNIQGYTMGELCHILGVEYVIQGVVSVEKTTSTNFTNAVSTTKTKNNHNKGLYVNKHGHIVGNIWGNKKGKKSTTQTNRVSTNVQNYSTSISMNIYNDRGSNIYSRDHSSFWNTKDAYKVTLKYLAKRSPFYRK